MSEHVVSELVTLTAGLAYLLAAVGIGCVFLRILRVEAPGYWRLSLASVSGIGIADAILTSSLYLGGGVPTLRIVLAAILVLGGLGIVPPDSRRCLFPILKGIRREPLLATFVIAALLSTLLISVAPSTKIDEVHYHMLVPRRVVEDNGLRPYRQPFESAIFPQLSFQYSLSALHAFGVPEAGNVVSWGISLALINLIVGVVTQLTNQSRAGWLFGAMAAVGLYPAVWYVTSGPHALGDLATTVAFCLYLLPKDVFGWMSPKSRLALICMAACVAATTKISLLPASLALSCLACFSVAKQIGWKAATALLVGVWAVMYAPSVIWSLIETHSPFGLLTATLFHSDFFDQSTIARLAEAREYRTQGLSRLLSVMMPSYRSDTFCR